MGDQLNIPALMPWRPAHICNSLRSASVTNLLGGPATASARRNSRSELGGRLAKNAFECSIKLRERLKADVVCYFADAEIRIQQPVARVFQSHTRDVVGEL